VLLLLHSETCGSGEDGCGISLIISISVSITVSRRGKAVYLLCKLISNWGFNSLKSWGVSYGTVVFYVFGSEVFLDIRCVIVEGLEFVARAVCAGGEMLIPWRCQDLAVTHVGVACKSSTFLWMVGVAFRNKVLHWYTRRRDV